MRAPAILLLAPVILVMGSPADACECADSTPEILAPHDGAAGVPTNTRVLVSALKAGAAKWAASDATAKPPALAVAPMRATKPGKGVKAAISTMMSENWGTVFVIAPARPLAPGTRYVIIATHPAPGAGAQSGQTVLGSFTTGKGPDKTAPVFGGLDNFTAVVSYRSPAGKCDGTSPFRELTWGYGEAQDAGTDPVDLLRILYVQKKGEPRQVRLIEPGGARPVTAVRGAACDPFAVGISAGDEVCAILEVVDLAGNAAGGVVEKCMAAKKM